PEARRDFFIGLESMKKASAATKHGKQTPTPSQNLYITRSRRCDRLRCQLVTSEWLPVNGFHGCGIWRFTLAWPAPHCRRYSSQAQPGPAREPSAQARFAQSHRLGLAHAMSRLPVAAVGSAGPPEPPGPAAAR